MKNKNEQELNEFRDKHDVCWDCGDVFKKPGKKHCCEICIMQSNLYKIEVGDLITRDEAKLNVLEKKGRKLKKEIKKLKIKITADKL